MTVERLPEEQLNRLPKWAQNHIYDLYHRLTSLSSADALTEPTRVVIEPFDAAKNIHDRATVRFYTGITHEYIDVCLGRDDKGELSYLNVASGLGQTIRVAPRASNLIHVTSER